jgi:hypothetical protein
MMLVGSAINFYGGIGKCNHKKFVKDNRFNTQKRIRTFTLQVAQRYFKGMTLHIAKKCLDTRMENDNNLDELSHQGNTSERNILSQAIINSLCLDWKILAFLRITLSEATT